VAELPAAIELIREYSFSVFSGSYPLNIRVHLESASKTAFIRTGRIFTYRGTNTPSQNNVHSVA